MSYAAVPELRSRLGASVFDEVYGESNEPDFSDLTGAADDLAAAAAEIDGVAGTRFTVPVAAAAARPLLADWQLTLAEERAYARSAGASAPEKLKERVAQVRKYLEMVLDGRFRIPGAVDGANGIGTYLTTEADAPNFDRESMGGF